MSVHSCQEFGDISGLLLAIVEEGGIAIVGSVSLGAANMASCKDKLIRT